MKKLIFLCLSIIFAFGGEMRVKFNCENVRAVAVLSDTSAAKSFYENLPLELNLKDYAGREKIADLPVRLNFAGDPSSDGKVGDLGYFSPWGNLVLYYKPQPYYEGVINLGKFESGFDEIIKCERVLIQKAD
ncbi:MULTISPECIES: cyclophilin-like fold protein [unclassified Campylobacter]|uniref:cyclophilin-like fold protein n=1 Tax=unclassified Campylobacter TaxID=2593542 RepID=UPI0022E9BB52|nr:MULTISPECIES: cyclophilin-like fold protein [unclassified Campylobacter]MDA3043784.1 cyclophilin-like fold protein [Campylobacter sp. JMF_09 ED2]MDA3044059.1 cyclophilin-like fold protein [Campylobacter sp. JMF_07 ED4]MDA3064006.1 cyclophilin-like fold protein [Campylobacter sp. JMF_11 EL3]MDA3072394.1 cyclophilin-like fold protein [Campylobacter sp. VBCF_03 NA9]MDA3074963.1 cyclophilin-like fold protein [Campylobacter sp. JMF_05 ED3]